MKRFRESRGVIDGKKICSNCRVDKNVNQFNKQKSSKSGLKSRCRECQKIDSNIYISKPENAEKSRIWRSKNKDKLKAYNKIWTNNPINKDRYAEKVKISADARYRILTNKIYSKSISLLFTSGMTFDNYGKWEIDHIIPITKWLDSGIKDLNIINSADNLQPLWKSENASKSNKLLTEI